MPRLETRRMANSFEKLRYGWAAGRAGRREGEGRERKERDLNEIAGSERERERGEGSRKGGKFDTVARLAQI